jgi:hypothetical protein
LRTTIKSETLAAGARAVVERRDRCRDEAKVRECPLDHDRFNSVPSASMHAASLVATDDKVRKLQGHKVLWMLKTYLDEAIEKNVSGEKSRIGCFLQELLAPFNRKLDMIGGSHYQCLAVHADGHRSGS